MLRSQVNHDRVQVWTRREGRQYYVMVRNHTGMTPWGQFTNRVSASARATHLAEFFNTPYLGLKSWDREVATVRPVKLVGPPICTA